MLNKLLPITKKKVEKLRENCVKDPNPHFKKGKNKVNK